MAQRKSRKAGLRILPNVSHGFSLVELLITVALIIILFVLLWGRSSRSYQRQQKLACQANLQNIYIALQIYANDFKESFPVRADAKTSEAALGLLVPRYTTVTSPFICPGTKKTPPPEGAPLDKHSISYAYYMGRRLADKTEPLMSDWQIDDQSKLKGQQVFSRDGKKPGNNHHQYGGNFLFSGGNVEMCSSVASWPLVLTQGVTLLNPKP
jgi:type II secretory pathway pseudopilin PulG